MAIRDVFTRRAARAAKVGAPDVYQYDQLPTPFRVQVVHVWQRALGREFPILRHSMFGPHETAWDSIEKGVAEEHGLLTLENVGDSFAKVGNYFLAASTGQALDVIEIVFDVIETHVRPNLQFSANYCTQHPDNAIDDLNQRFREHGIGYQLVEGEIVRVDSQYVHAEAVKPALALLQHAAFKGPEDEFMRAHKHYRDGNHKEAINEALKAFESTLKAICSARKWAYDKNKDTAKTLIDIVLREGLVPPYLLDAFNGLRSVLSSTVPTARNRTSGHGQGPDPQPVPDYLAAYVLHMTASNIVFLVQAHETKAK